MLCTAIYRSERWNMKDSQNIAEMRGLYIKIKINEHATLSSNLIYKGKRIDEVKISPYSMIKFSILFTAEKQLFSIS